MDYPETLDFLFTRLPLFSRIGAAAYKADLTNIIALCEKLGNPHKEFRSVHVAGTNGKGSVSHMLAAVLQSAELKTGLYTSPHLHDFRERIRIDGKPVPKNFVVDFTEKIRVAIDELEPSFFEITVAMAFAWFAEQAVDMAVIEVGLGGRLDSTNIISPELSVITNISYDHMDLLGNTLEAIAREKAGIIKERVPVVIGERQPAVEAIFRGTAAAKHAVIRFASDHRFAADWKFSGRHLEVAVTDASTNNKTDYVLDMAGVYQLKNLVTVTEAIAVLRENGFRIPQAAVAHALANVRRLTGLHGRWEVIREKPLVALDVAHNEAGLAELARQIELTPHATLHIVFGMVNDKDTARSLAQLPRQARYYFTRAQTPRAMGEEELAAAASEFNLSGQVFPDVNAAFAAATAHAHADDLIVVCGSVFLVAELRYSS